MKKLLIGTVVLVSAFILVGTVMAVGNGWTGYNRTARVFVGTGQQYCDQKYESDPAGVTQCLTYLEGYLNDKITMKWNEAWDTCNTGGNCIGAWTDNEWNGMFPNGSRETWHYKILWVGPELEDSEYWKDGGYPIWGEYEMIMSHGTAGGEHIWDTRAIPNGYGN